MNTDIYLSALCDTLIQKCALFHVCVQLFVVTFLDIDECLGNPCDGNATCSNNAGSYSCACNSGFSGNGTVCQDIDECTTGQHSCDANAACSNTIGSYSCACNTGYSGNGTVCQDIDECTTNQHSCDANAACSNTIGSYSCACNTGYSGNGTVCEDIDECTTNQHSCDANAVCSNTAGSFSCNCTSGYSGNGTTCTGRELFSMLCYIYGIVGNYEDTLGACLNIGLYSTEMVLSIKVNSLLAVDMLCE